LQLLRTLQRLQLGLVAEQARDVDYCPTFGAPRRLVPLRDVERDGRAPIALFDDGRCRPAAGALAGCEHRQLGRAINMTLGVWFTVDGDAEAEARQARPQELVRRVSEGVRTACEPRFEVAAVARKDAVLRVGSGVVVVL